MKILCKLGLLKKSPKLTEEFSSTPVMVEGDSYGLEELGSFLLSKDYGWTKPDKKQKRVILCNPLDCKGKISLRKMLSAWRGTGHAEWEAVLSGWFVKAVVEAINNNVNEADITCLFNRDFIASGSRRFSKEEVYNHIIKWFDIVEETDESLNLRFHI